MQYPAGEMVGYIRKRFLLYPEIEIANFMQTDRGNSNAHSVVYVCTAHAVPSLHILHSVGLLFLNSFLQGVWRCPISMNGTKSHASLMPFWLTNLIIVYMSEQGVIVLNRMYSGWKIRFDLTPLAKVMLTPKNYLFLTL